MAPSEDGSLHAEDVAWILKVLDESDFDSIDLRVGDFALRARKSGTRAAEPLAAPSAAVLAPQAASAAAAPPSAQAAPPAAEAAPAPPPAPAASVPDGAEGMFAVRAPTVGTFYRAPEPGADPYVREGTHVEADSTVGLVEVMKMFNAVSAGVDGTVRQVLATDGGPVEYDQLLMLIDPD
jgi:acetyl-CoA carboxylase biotin carboxyl carrier protein